MCSKRSIEGLRVRTMGRDCVRDRGGGVRIGDMRGGWGGWEVCRL